MSDAFNISLDEEHILKKGASAYERGQRLKDRVINTKQYICIQRARIITKVYKENEGDNIYSLRSKAFNRILREMSIYILDDELIVGHQAEKQRSAPIFPEFAVQWIKDEIDVFETRAQDKFIVTKEVKNEFLEEVYPYWKGKTFYDRIRAELTEEIALQRFDANVFSTGVHEDGGLGHILLDFEAVIKNGLKGIKEQIKSQLENLDISKPENIRKRHFYNACISMCDSAVIFAKRYAALAREMADIEKDGRRKTELLQIAENCENVPENPARSFYEALQSLWFMQLLIQIYDNGVSITPGRFDQYIYPYYANDVKNGKITKKQAQEILEALWVKFTEPIKIYRAADAASHAGYPMGQNLVVGGVGKDGNDMTNDLTYRCLEAHCHMLLMQPNFSVRLHNKTPNQLMAKVAEAIKLGNGMPQIVNDELFIPALMNIGVPLKEARDYAPVGCVEVTPLNAWGRCNGGYFNLTKIVELALNNGVCMVTGKQVGPQTGDPKEFSTFEDVLAAYKKQMEYSVKINVTWNNVIDMIHEEKMPTPLTSIMVGDCIEKGKDVTSGGARYNWTGPLAIGIANTGNSLMAIKKAVFEDKKVKMSEMIEALKGNFEGYEELKQYLVNKVPKYGNDEPEVDSMVKLATDIYFDTLVGHTTYRGGPFVGALLPVSSYVAFGLVTGPTPDGRKLGEPLADGISPTYGTDVKGPTAVFKSVCTLEHLRCPNGMIFNQKFDPGPLSNHEGMKKFIDLIRTYVLLGGGHIQFNIVSADTLKEAQKDPQKHKGLVVRVAGYSAFFNELAKEVQDTIIARTEQML